MKITADSENNRLFRDRYHNLEYLQTMECLKRHLPTKGKILDIGGGTGVYAFELYKAGYDVVLLDISQEIIEKSKYNYKKIYNHKFNNKIDFIVADVRDIDEFISNEFDIVLCLGGVLSIINSETERTSVINKIINAGKNNSILIISILGYIALLRTIFTKYPNKLSDKKILEMLLTKKQCTVGDKNEVWQFFRVSEFRTYLNKFPLYIKEIVGCEGLSSNLFTYTNSIESILWDNWYSLFHEFGNDETIADTSEHIIFICQIVKD